MLSHKELDTKKKINFSFEMLRIKTKEFREKVWFNNLLYFLLIALFILLVGINCQYLSIPIRFCSLMGSELMRLIKKRNNYYSEIKADELRRRSSSRKPSKKGFNRLPQNEEESELVTRQSDDDQDGSDVLEDFSLSNRTNNVI